MRLVADTNIFISAAFKESSWPGMVVRWLDEFGGLPRSDATEAQVMDVLQRPYFAPKVPPAYLDRVRRIFAQAEPGDNRRAHRRMPRSDRRQVS